MIKFNLEPIDVDMCEVNPLFPIVSGFNNINELVKFNPFIYKHPEPTLIKIVANWNIVGRTADLETKAFEINAEQEIILLIDGNEDLDTIEKAVDSSHLNLQQEFTKRVANTAMRDYVFMAFNGKTAAKHIFEKLQ